MSGHDIIVVGASAGGLEVLVKLLCDLPPDIPAALFVVIHIPAHSTSFLPKILNRALKKRHQGTSLLQATHPYDGEEIQHGRIYVAPPDHHLLVKDGYIHLARGPKENGHRPAVDPLFRTAARVYRQRVVGIVLSGTLDDGTAGLAAVKQLDGTAIVQDPDEAVYSGMPRSAIENVDVDYVLPVSEITSVLAELAHKPVTDGGHPMPSDLEMESDMAELELTAMQSFDRPGTPSPFACPECSGVLWEINEGKLTRFRCRTGHAYSTQSLLAEQSENLEEALWSALRALEEKAALSQRMAVRARENAQAYSAKRFQEQGEDCQQRAALIRKLLLKSNVNGLSTGNGKPKAPIAPSIFSVVAIAASADGTKALSQLLSELPSDFPAAIAIVQHLSRQNPNQLVDALSSQTTLAVKQAEAGDLLQPGRVYIAPPNRHLLVNPDQTLSLSESELVHFVRPSADLLFETVAASFKKRAIAVVLTDTDGNGAMGVQAIEKMGGTVILQDQVTSKTELVDWVVPLQEIAATLVSLAKKDEKSLYS